VRERQDLGWRWQAADRGLSDALGRADAKQADKLRRDMASLDARIAGLDATLREQFPDYAALVNPLASAVGSGRGPHHRHVRCHERQPRHWPCRSAPTRHACADGR
jgi:hypothetical protein